MASTVGDLPANRIVVPVTGSAAQIDAAFHVQMNLYQHPSEKRSFFAADREPSLDLAVPVAHIAGLDDYSPPHPMLVKGPSDHQPFVVTGSGPGGSYLGSDMRAAYYGGTTLDGNGQTVGLFEFGGYALSDVNLSFSSAGQSYKVPINNVLLDGMSGASDGDDGEEVLDIVQAIGMAPNLSQVRVYIGELDADILNAMASEDIAKQISCSWGWRPADPTTADVFFKEMAAQGQSFFTASGDDGAFDAAISPFFYPGEDQYVTAVGGTHLTTNGAAGGWVAETVWNSGEAGSGGGISPDGIAIPSYQVGVANSANGGSTTLRNVPDVAMEGDFDNYACDEGACSATYAGTSFAAPRWAGFMALVNQQAIEAGNAPMGGLGFLNPLIYPLAQAAASSADFHDITVGNNDTDNQPLYFTATPGYDLTTGFGSANGQKLIDALAGPQVPGFFLSSAQNAVAVNPGGTGSTTFTISDAGTFSGSVTLALTSSLPSGVTASFSPNPYDRNVRADADRDRGRAGEQPDGDHHGHVRYVDGEHEYHALGACAKLRPVGDAGGHRDQPGRFGLVDHRGAGALWIHERGQPERDRPAYGRDRVVLAHVDHRHQHPDAYVEQHRDAGHGHGDGDGDVRLADREHRASRFPSRGPAFCFTARRASAWGRVVPQLGASRSTISTASRAASAWPSPACPRGSPLRSLPTRPPAIPR